MEGDSRVCHSMSMRERWLAAHRRTSSSASSLSRTGRSGSVYAGSGRSGSVSSGPIMIDSDDDDSTESYEEDGYEENGHEGEEDGRSGYGKGVSEGFSPMFSRPSSYTIARYESCDQDRIKNGSDRPGTPVSDGSGSHQSQYDKHLDTTPSSRKRQRSRDESLDDDTTESRQVGRMYVKLIKTAEKASIFERKLQEMASSARSLSAEASEACEVLMSSPSFSPRVNAKYYGIPVDFRVQDLRTEDRRERTLANVSTHALVRLSPLSYSPVGRSDRHDFPITSHQSQEPAAEQPPPQNDNYMFLTNIQTLLNGTTKTLLATGNKKEPAAPPHLLDDPKQTYFPCTACYPTGTPCVGGSPSHPCTACTSANLPCAYDPNHRIPMRDLKWHQRLLITTNPFREIVYIGGRPIRKTDEEWAKITDKQKIKYLRCLDLEGDGGVDVDPPCDGCRKKGARCRAPGPFSAHGKEFKHSLAKGNANCSRCILVNPKGGCSLNMNPPGCLNINPRAAPMRSRAPGGIELGGSEREADGQAQNSVMNSVGVE